MTRVVDAHVHLWKADDGFHDWLASPVLAKINTNFSSDELGARTTLAGVDAVILVEGGTPTGEDTDLLLAQTQASSRFAGVIAWIDLVAPDVERRIAELRAGPRGDRILGFRTQVQGENDDYLAREDVRAGLTAIGRASLPFELVIRHQQRPSVLALLDALPDARLVVDHLGGPDFSAKRPSAEWTKWMRELAKRSNVDAKLSALHAGESDDAGREELVAVALATMAPSRLAWGSDWPMSLLHRTYAQTVASARSLLAGLSESERAAIFGGTAERVYGLA